MGVERPAGEADVGRTIVAEPFHQVLAAAHDPDGKLIYRAGQALIDPAHPTRELARLTTPFLVPETPEEVAGQVNNVVFVEGLVAYKGEWLMYYGQGDAGVGLLHGASRSACG